MPFEASPSYKNANLPNKWEFDEQRMASLSTAHGASKLKLNTSIIMSEPFLGEIKCVGFNFAPRGYAFCDGHMMSIAQNSALFALLGTTFGGNGQTTYALPDLRGRAAVGMGTGPGLQNVAWGQAFGSPTTTILNSNLPSHAHGTLPTQGSVSIPCNPAAGTTNDPTGAYPAAVQITVDDPGGAVTATAKAYASGPATPSVNLAAGTASIPAGSTGLTGGNQPIDNQPPSLGLNYIIAIQGIFPSRN